MKRLRSQLEQTTLCLAMFSVVALAGCGFRCPMMGRAKPAPEGHAQMEAGAASSPQASESGHTHHDQVAYRCAMKCEGTKTYDKPGKCPKCGMALKPVKMQKMQ